MHLIIPNQNNIRMKYFILLLTLSSVGLFAQKNVSLICSKSRINSFDNSIALRETGNQNEFDMGFYKLQLTIFPGSEQIKGNAEIDCYSLVNNLDELDFDITSSLNINKITLGGENILFEHKSDILKVFLNKKYDTGEKITISIDYSGKPGNSFHFDTKFNSPLIWTLCEPYGSKDWWPCKNLPDDKLDSMDIIVTVPEDLIVASNGTLFSTTTNNGKITYYWKERYPIASYLVSVAIHPYKLRTDYYHYDNDSMPVISYILSGNFDNNNEKYAIVSEMIETLSSYYGQYPFIKEKYGNAEFPWGGGMEHQTVTSLLGPYEYLLVHELGHQWWGDMITCRDFHHIWLNEGFATYTEALWAEHKGGIAELHSYMDKKKYLGNGTIYVDDISQSGRIFSGALSYNKASWVLHTLRHIVGDSIFFDILHQYAQSDKKYDVATTEDFVRICNNVSGMNLDRFFDQWIYGDFHPVYLYDWNYEENQGNYIVHLSIEQFQTENLFSMPIDIAIETGSGKENFVIQNDEKLQNYSFTLPEKPLSLALDEDDWILKESYEGISLINHDNNEMTLTVSNTGSLGYDKPDGKGYGLIYPLGGENNLFFGTLMFGNSDDYVADNPEKGNQKDFIKLENSRIRVNESPVSDLNINTKYTDKGHPLSKNIKINQTSYSWSLNPQRNFIIFHYEIGNNGDEDLDSFYVGQFLDFDVDNNYLDNYIDKDSERKMMFQYGENLYLGIRLLSYHVGDINYTGIINAVDILQENKKYPYLSGTKNDFVTNKKGDWTSLLSVGPYNFKAGDTISLDFAIIGAETKNGLNYNADIAEQIYNYYITGNDNSITNNQDKVIVYPNPVVNKINLEIKSQSSQNADIRLYNVNGNKVFSGKKHLQTGNNHITINKNFAPGVYFYQIETAKKVMTGKIISVCQKTGNF